MLTRCQEQKILLSEWFHLLTNIWKWRSSFWISLMTKSTLLNSNTDQRWERDCTWGILFRLIYLLFIMSNHIADLSVSWPVNIFPIKSDYTLFSISGDSFVSKDWRSRRMPFWYVRPGVWLRMQSSQSKMCLSCISWFCQALQARDKNYYWRMSPYLCLPWNNGELLCFFCYLFCSSDCDWYKLEYNVSFFFFLIIR